MKSPTIPTAFAQSETLASAYQLGFDRGHGFACHKVPTLGDKVFSDSLGRVTVDAENIREVHQDACIAAESASRNYSPFEFTAHEFNESEESDELWEAYDAGIADAIVADLAGYSDEDYGIPAKEQLPEDEGFSEDDNAQA